MSQYVSKETEVSDVTQREKLQSRFEKQELKLSQMSPNWWMTITIWSHVKTKEW